MRDLWFGSIFEKSRKNLDICVCDSGEEFKLELYICDFMVNKHNYKLFRTYMGSELTKGSK